MAGLEIATIPCRTDNYAYLLRAPNGAVGVVDAPEAAPIRAALEARGWGLDWIWLTHHHPDHVAGVAELVATTGARVAGARRDADRLPPLDLAVDDGETLHLGDARARVLDVSGHTLNHIAFHFPDAKAAFTGDSLFVLGCGRLFEGTAAQMWSSLSKLARLDPETTIWCGHEYSLANLTFARSIEPDNPDLAEQGRQIEAARAEGRPTVPGSIGRELAANPFLRVGTKALQAALGHDGSADAAALFAELRRRKDAF